MPTGRLLEVKPDPTSGQNEQSLRYEEALQGAISTIRILIKGREDVVINDIQIVH